METIKPTTEELNNHYQFNRKYFDELAKYYYENDKEYYTLFIKPFFNQPVQTIKKKSSKPLVIAIIAVIITIIIPLICFISGLDKDKKNTSSTSTDRSIDRTVEDSFSKTINGNKDDVISYTMPSGMYIIQADYYADRNFIVTLKNDSGKMIDLLVNTIGKYSGKNSFRINSKGTYYFEIKASGSYSIVIEKK